ncbi:purine-cytosine permease family protein [Paenibacillus eucommiae]|uniref:Cytosine permease n=1 Tax=Paenibacillus eucommiae TaxID=1355755 RepID=A0ABS4IW52_9BACL|nr:cytosine permease [Paenibacillus eucommiae]MBP1991818.1 cytosine permease [Paenibacillus eucommiae]
MNANAEQLTTVNIKTEDYAVQSVPQDQRRSLLNVSITSCAWIISLSTLFTGGALAAGLPFGKVIAAGFIGMLIVAVYGFFQGVMGAKYGVSTTVLARQAFGRQGAGLFGIMLAVTLGIGWFAWQVAFFGITMSEMFPGQWFAEPKVAMVWGGILMMLTAFIGYRGLAAISFIAVPLVGILSIWGIVAAVNSSGSWSALMDAVPVGDPITLFAGITIVVGNCALGAVVFPDITRFGKSPVKGGFGASSGYFLGGLFCIVAGAAMAIAANVPQFGSTPNIPAAMAKLGLGFFAFLILVFAQWTTNDNNLYSGALGLRNAVKVPKSILVVTMGIIGLIIALSGLENSFVPFLTMLGNFVPPIAGVMIADHWFVKPRLQGKSYQFGPGTTYAKWNIAALVATVGGGFVGSRLDFGIGPINAILIAFIGYSLLAFVLKKMSVSYELGVSIEERSGF